MVVPAELDGSLAGFGLIVILSALVHILIVSGVVYSNEGLRASDEQMQSDGISEPWGVNLMNSLWYDWWHWGLLMIGGVACSLWLVLLVPAAVYKTGNGDQHQLGRLERIFARFPSVLWWMGPPDLPRIDAIGKRWRELDRRYGSQVDEAFRAQRALFGPALNVSILIFFLGFGHMAPIFLGPNLTSSSWAGLSFPLMVFSAVPYALTLFLYEVRWRNRMWVEGQFLEKSRNVVFRLRSDLQKCPERLTTDKVSRRLVGIERLMRTRYRRPSVDTQLGDKEEATQWMENIVPLLGSQIKLDKLEDPKAVVSATIAWIDQAAGLFDQKPSWPSLLWKRIGRRKLSESELAELYQTRRYPPQLSWAWLLLLGGGIFSLILFFCLREVERSHNIPGLFTYLVPLVGGLFAIVKEWDSLKKIWGSLRN